MDAPRCALCPEPAVHHARYAGTHRCRHHFLRFVQERVQRDVKAAGRLPPGTRIAVAVSGGKDSIVCLRLLHRIFSRNRSVELVAITVDEGIQGYRPEGLRIAQKACRDLDVPHHVASYRETVGRTMDEVHRIKGEATECSYCGVFRRDALNQAARDLEADRLATGHNLDDMAQTVLMNLLGGDLEKIGRMAPHTEPRQGLVPRLLPLRSIPEQETYLTALLEGWPIHDAECPYARNASRNRYRDLLAQLETDTPGTRHTLLRVGDEIKSLLTVRPDADRPAASRSCRRCGAPATGLLCQKCVLLDRLAQRAPIRL